MRLLLRNSRLLGRKNAGTCARPPALASDHHHGTGWPIGGRRIGRILIRRGNQLLQCRIKSGVNLLHRIGWRQSRLRRHNRSDALFTVALRRGLLTNASADAFTFKPGIPRIQNPVAELPIGQQFFDEQAPATEQEPGGQQTIGRE